MLNYLSAELWRMARRRSALLLWGIYLLLVFLIGLTLRGTGAMTALENFRNFMLMGIYLAFPLADWAIGGAVRAGGLGNEVSFGLSRSRIYLGKLCSALLGLRPASEGQAVRPAGGDGPLPADHRGLFLRRPHPRRPAGAERG